MCPNFGTPKNDIGIGTRKVLNIGGTKVQNIGGPGGGGGPNFLLAVNIIGEGGASEIIGGLAPLFLRI